VATTDKTTVDTMRNDFVAGLRNAHAVEAQAKQVMQRQIDRSAEYPEMRARLEMHLQETENQQKRLEDILADMGESHSTLKDAVLGTMGNVMAMGHAVATDEVIKNSLENSAFEHYEVAMYKSLLTMADAVGATRAAPLLQESLAEEEHMAAWCDEHIAEVTRTYLHRHAKGDL
jgi:ferritin-like metal-binding protein YciE